MADTETAEPKTEPPAPVEKDGDPGSGGTVDEDAVLSALDAKHGVEGDEDDSEPSTPPEEEAPPKKEEKPKTLAPKETDQESEKPEKADKTKSRSPEEEAQLERALKALGRDQAPASLRDKLLKGDKETMDYALQRADAQAIIDEKLVERAKRLQEEAKAQKETDGGEQRESSQAPVQMTSDTAVPDVLNPFYKNLSNELGGDVAAEATSSLQNWGKKLVEPLHEVIGHLMSNNVRADIQKLYPQVEDPQKWDAVDEKATALWKGGGYEPGVPGVRQAHEDAAGLIFGPALSSQETPPKEEADTPAPPTPTRRKEPTVFRTQDAKDEAILNALEAGDHDKADRLAKRKVVPG